MALSADRHTPRKEGVTLPFPVAASTQIFVGALVALNADGNLVPASADATCTVIGRAEEAVNNTGLAGALTCQVNTSGVFYYANDITNPVLAAGRGERCFVVDDETVSASSDSGDRPVAGIVMDVDSGGVWIFIRPLIAVPFTVDTDDLAAAAVTAAKLGAAAVTGPKLHADVLTPWVVTGADATSAAQDLDAVGAVAGLRIVSVINLTTPGVVDKATITAGVDKFVQASGNLDAAALLIFTLPAAA